MRRAGLVGCLVAAAMLAGACSGGDSDEGPPSGAPSDPATDEGSGGGGEVDFPAPTRRQLAKGVRVGDQTTQALSDVVARGQTLVAVGGEFADNTSRPLFVLSTDGGDTWTRSEVTDPAREMTTSESATSVARSRNGFVATGNDNEGPVIWSSPDGVSWARQKADRAVFKAADWVERVRYVDGRFVLIGGNEAAAGAAHDRVIMWTSRNGAQWKRVDLTTRGIDDVVGEPSAVDVTYYRGDLIIAGGVENNAIADQPNRIVIWRSRNGGRSFTTDSTPADLAGDYRAYADDFVLNGGELYLTASGDGTGKTWDAVVLRATGGAWEKITAAPLSTSAADHPGALIGVSGGWVYGGRTTEGAEDARIATGGTFADLAALRHPGLTARGRQLITAGAAVGRRAILVGITDASGSTEPAIWRVERGRATPVRLPAEVTGGRPHIYVTEILRTDRGWTAVGTVGLSPASGAAPTWRAGHRRDSPGATTP
ncbi:hypothetical protein [Nocardioides sp. GXZ039]|uniref:hypothetical protein n=1 Tax=Nocardioides sp. GXZ039 TaxID=3136018 RepID=UPI0030F4185A